MTNEQLVLKIQAGETQFMGMLWEQVERFALQQIGKFYSRHTDRCKSLGVDMENLRQEAYLILYGAIEGYNADKGVKFLTYANYHFIKCFYAAVGLHRATRKYSEVSFDYAVNDNGETVTLLSSVSKRYMTCIACARLIGSLRPAPSPKPMRKFRLFGSITASHIPSAKFQYPLSALPSVRIFVQGTAFPV